MKSIITNKEELSITPLREKTLDIIEAGISSVLPMTVMKKTVKFDPAAKILSILDHTFDISKGRIFVTGGGKTAGLMPKPWKKSSARDILLPVLLIASMKMIKRLKFKSSGLPTLPQRGRCFRSRTNAGS
ncbi:MAG: hypothetical protein MUF15_12505 [Acidobacteria bacterium]|jgi:hypothetical protein|nr:hypothetical protein [Acidobacteriota bacterium]